MLAQAPQAAPLDSSQDAWRVLGLIRPIGSPAFRNAWESFHPRGNGQALSMLMEQFIWLCKDKRIDIPRAFFAAKQIVEKRESREREQTAEEIVRLEVPD